MKSFKALLVVCLLLFALQAHATCTLLNPGNISKPRVLQCTNDWTSAAGGGATTTVIVTTAAAKVVKIETVPGALGDLTTDLPDADYDITITDGYSFDIAAGGLANRSGTVAEAVYPSSAIYITGTLTLNVAAAGAANSGRTIVTLEE